MSQMLLHFSPEYKFFPWLLQMIQMMNSTTPPVTPSVNYSKHGLKASHIFPTIFSSICSVNSGTHRRHLQTNIVEPTPACQSTPFLLQTCKPVSLIHLQEFPAFYELADSFTERETNFLSSHFFCVCCRYLCALIDGL